MIHVGDVFDVLPTLEAGSVRCCVTSPPYWGLRDYGCEGQLGLEETPEQYVENMVRVFREVRRVLADDGTLWLNLGDSYASGGTGGDTRTGFNARYFGTDIVDGKQSEHGKQAAKHDRTHHGLKPKDLVGIPWRVAFALQADGWWLRSDIIWSKPNPMPESVTDRPTKSHEYIFLLTKSARYYYDHDAIAEKALTPNSVHVHVDGNRTKAESVSDDPRYATRPQKTWVTGTTRNRRTVWTISTKPFPDAHFAVFPETLPSLCIQAGSAIGDTVLDPFSGTGTTGVVAQKLGREYVGIELNPEYAAMSEKRIDGTPLSLFTLDGAA